MAVSIALSSVAATLVSLTVSGSSGYQAIEIQYGTRPDFAWSLAPIVRLAAQDGLVSLAGLNQSQRYFFRARGVVSAFASDPFGAALATFTPVAALRDVSPATVMIRPALIVPPEPVLAWSASSELAGFPARSLGRDDPNSVWGAQKASGLVAFEAMTSGAPIDTIAILETTAGEDATVRVIGGASLAAVRGSSPGYATSPAPFRASAGLPGRRAYHGLVRLGAPVSYPVWRVEISGSMPGDIFMATYAVLGLDVGVSRNFQSDSKDETILDRGALERDRSGNPSRTLGQRGRTVDFTIQNLTEAEYESKLERLRWWVGTTDPLLVVPNSRPGVFLHDRILFGQLAAGKASNTSSPRFDQEFTVTSLI